MKKALAGLAVLSLLFVIGCPAGGDTAELEEKVKVQQEKITELEKQVEMLTMERDSLATVITEMEQGSSGQTGGTTGGQTGGTTPPPGKPPRTGR